MADDQLDLQEQVTRINRSIAETAKYAAEQHKLAAEQGKLAVEQGKLAAEAQKLYAEARLFDRNRWQGWQIVITAMTAGAALFGASAAFVKLVFG